MILSDLSASRRDRSFAMALGESRDAVYAHVSADRRTAAALADVFSWFHSHCDVSPAALLADMAGRDEVPKRTLTVEPHLLRSASQTLERMPREFVEDGVQRIDAVLDACSDDELSRRALAFRVAGQLLRSTRDSLQLNRVQTAIKLYLQMRAGIPHAIAVDLCGGLNGLDKPWGSRQDEGEPDVLTGPHAWR